MYNEAHFWKMDCNTQQPLNLFLSFGGDNHVGFGPQQITVCHDMNHVFSCAFNPLVSTTLICVCFGRQGSANGEFHPDPCEILDTNGLNL